VSEMRERELHNCFYTGLLNHKATSSLPRQPEPGFHYIQKFYKSNTKIRLLNKEPHNIFDSQNSRQLSSKNHTYRPEITSGKQLEVQEHPNQMVALPSQPYMCSLSYSQAKIPSRTTKIFKLHVAIVYCKERVFLEKNDKILASKSQKLSSALENTTYIVWFKWNQSIEFFVQSADILNKLKFLFNLLISLDLS